eukprot:2048036-Rhodomonas_salina.2
MQGSRGYQEHLPRTPPICRVLGLVQLQKQRHHAILERLGLRHEWGSARQFWERNHAGRALGLGPDDDAWNHLVPREIRASLVRLAPRDKERRDQIHVDLQGGLAAPRVLQPELELNVDRVLSFYLHRDVDPPHVVVRHRHLGTHRRAPVEVR